MSGTEFVGFIDGVELESYRRVVSRKEALELNPGAFGKEESIQIVQESYEVLGEIVARHDEWQLASYPAFNVSPDSGGVYALEDLD